MYFLTCKWIRHSAISIRVVVEIIKKQKNTPSTNHHSAKHMLIVAWYFFLIFGEVKWSEVKIAQSCPTFCNSMDYTVRGILQGRILEWVAVPFSRGSSQPRDQIQVSCIAGGFFASWATREDQEYWSGEPLPSPDLLNPGIKPGSPALQADSLLTELLFTFMYFSYCFAEELHWAPVIDIMTYSIYSELSRRFPAPEGEWTWWSVILLFMYLQFQWTNNNYANPGKPRKKVPPPLRKLVIIYVYGNETIRWWPS